MKHTNFILLFLAGCFAMTKVTGQANATLNILTLNSGQVNINSVVDIQVTVGATTGSGGQTVGIGVNKVRPQIAVPSAIATILPNIDQTGLPAGWIINSNNGSTIVICNGSDAIAVGDQRQILIKVQGTAIGGPSTVGGSFASFGNGTSCTSFGTLAGDITSDNTSTSSIQVVSGTTPVTLTNFDAALVNCQPVLHWITETEINSDHFAIERSIPNNSDWIPIGVVASNGNTTTKHEYSFVDRNINTSSEKVLYRLKMIDLDGKYKYSDVLYVYVNCNATRMNVYPNPVQNGRLYVSLTGTNGQSEASLLSLSGQVILKSKVHNGTNYLNVSNIAAGIYVLNVKDANGVDRKVKVSIQH